MNIDFKKILSGFMAILLIVNMFLYTRTMVLSDQMMKLEKDTNKLRVENSVLQQKLANNNSIENLNKLAQKYGFTKIDKPEYLDQLHFAFKVNHD
ncbi:hypothetical protein A3J15_03340 [Candidatus Roizmanbacteria bacterium RIFCSPLOWO2_02_FULL_38_10]|uniref:Uncharacterized protein n=1 Tax=Candidatus Roizmanbacteria bacterium RIFCSPLOWO2_02_FULL_38_10 TaxID=1802074 RepID=A0A1F7JMX6_9BACT|nr:MAG: hypothetical protein A3J15_03340 [Candidatus Roizmanbacteria bacterium RIFCSPLOWO2_02_FULL_38_10]